MSDAVHKPDEHEDAIAVHMVFKAVDMDAGFSGQEGHLKNINIEVRTGERVALMGVDHLTRAMLLRVLVGLRPKRGGYLEVLEYVTQELPFYADWDQTIPQHIRRRLGVCLEVEGLLNNVTVREGLELLFRFKYGDHNEKLRQGAAKIATVTCEKFGLGSAVDKRPFLLTSAEKRLAGLARAFLTKPKVLALENPSQNIGDASREKLFKALEYMGAQAERTMVISTEDWALAWKFCSRWVVLEGNTIVFDGPAKDFVKSRHPMLAQVKTLSKVNESFEQLVREIAA